jgi:hypothetical protein
MMTTMMVQALQSWYFSVWFSWLFSSVLLLSGAFVVFSSITFANQKVLELPYLLHQSPHLTTRLTTT